MEIETAQIGIALASYVAGIASNWWWENRKKVLGNIEETLEDKIEDLIGRKVSFYLASKFLADREHIILFNSKEN